MTKYPDPTPIYVVVIVLLFYEGENVYCNSINLKKNSEHVAKICDCYHSEKRLP